MSQEQKQDIYDENDGPFAVDRFGRATYGSLIRWARKRYRIDAEYVGVLYGQLEGGPPVTGRHVQRMEQNDTFFPRDKSPNRRWMLAKLLNIPPTLLGLTELDGFHMQTSLHKDGFSFHVSGSIDVEEYYHRLEKYWLHDHDQEAHALDIQGRIDLLHNRVLYVNRGQKKHMIQLLCGYQLLMADIAHERKEYQVAKSYFRNAITLTKEKECYDLLVLALQRRAAFFVDTGDFISALHNFERIHTLEKYAPPQALSKLISSEAIAKAHQAQNKQELSEALSFQDRATPKTGPFSTDNFLFIASFDEERFALNKASAFMASPNPKLRSPKAAQEWIELSIKHSVTKYADISKDRQIYRDLIQAKIYFDEGYHSVSAAAAENALTTMLQKSSTIHIDEIAQLTQELKLKQPFCLEVATLEIALMKIQQPYLFN